MTDLLNLIVFLVKLLFLGKLAKIPKHGKSGEVKSWSYIDDLGISVDTLADVTLTLSCCFLVISIFCIKGSHIRLHFE